MNQAVRSAQETASRNALKVDLKNDRPSKIKTIYLFLVSLDNAAYLLLETIGVNSSYFFMLVILIRQSNFQDKNLLISLFNSAQWGFSQ